MQKVYGRNPRFSLDDTVEGVTRLEDGHRSLFAHGAWTDDTDQAILILQSFIERSNGTLPLDPKDFARRLRQWCKEGLVSLGTPADDIGMTASVALPTFEH